MEDLEWQEYINNLKAPEFVDLPEASTTLSPEIYQQVRKLHFKNFDTGAETYTDAVVYHRYRTQDYKEGNWPDDEDTLRARQAVAAELYNTFGVPREVFPIHGPGKGFGPTFDIPRFLPNHYGVIAARRHERGDWEIVIVAQEPDLDEWSKQFTGWNFFVIDNETLQGRLRSVGV